MRTVGNGVEDTSKGACELLGPYPSYSSVQFPGYNDHKEKRSLKYMNHTVYMDSASLIFANHNSTHIQK